MARLLRIELAGGLYHVTSCGDRREDIFLDDDDRRFWLEIFDSVCKRCNWACHAWCQMSNITISWWERQREIFPRACGSSTACMFGRSTADIIVSAMFFQQRYRGIIVEKETCLLKLIRYVVLNPVRAGMVADAADWPWSSYSAMVSTASRPEGLHTDWILGQFSQFRGKAIRGYIDFVRAGIGQPGL